MDGAQAESPYNTRVLAHVDSWPSVGSEAASCGSGEAITVAGGQVAHLHASGDAEILLGSGAVERLRPALRKSGRVKVDDETIRIRLETESDVTLVLSLLSVAIKTYDEAGGNGPWCRVSRKSLKAG